MNLVTRNHNDLKHSFDKVFGDLMIMRDENAKIIVLYAADTTKSSTVRVYWNSSTRETFVDVISLSSPDSTRQFQLWAMVKGQATDAGLFNVNPDAGIQRLKLVMNADAWVVTLEPAGGSTAPTPDQVYLISKL